MTKHQAAHSRNSADVDHASSGKTTLCEAIPARAGVVSRLGNLAASSTNSDDHVSEINRQISI